MPRNEQEKVPLACFRHETELVLMQVFESVERDRATLKTEHIKNSNSGLYARRTRRREAMLGGSFLEHFVKNGQNLVSDSR
jgi:hypothetical protein